MTTCGSANYADVSADYLGAANAAVNGTTNQWAVFTGAHSVGNAPYTPGQGNVTGSGTIGQIAAFTGSTAIGSIGAAASLTPGAWTVPITGADGTLNNWVGGRTIVGSASNSYNVGTAANGIWNTVAYVTMPMYSAATEALATVVLTAGTNGTICYLRTVFDSTTAFGVSAVPIAANYTVFSSGTIISATSGLSGSKTVELQLKDDGAHTCTVMAYGSQITVRTTN